MLFGIQNEVMASTFLNLLFYFISVGKEHSFVLHLHSIEIRLRI